MIGMEILKRVQQQEGLRESLREEEGEGIIMRTRVMFHAHAPGYGKNSQRTVKEKANWLSFS